MKGIYPNEKKGRFGTKYKLKCVHCGNYNWQYLWILKLLFVFKKEVYYYCPICHKGNCYVQVSHIVHNSTNKEEKEYNKDCWEKRLLK